MLPTPFEFFLLALASFRLTHFIVFDRLGHVVRSPFVDANDQPNQDGPLRTIGEGITCYWCTGVWVTGLLYTGFWLLPSWILPVIAVLAIAGLQAVLESFVQRG